MINNQENGALPSANVSVMHPPAPGVSAPPHAARPGSRSYRWWWLLIVLIVTVIAGSWQFRRWRDQSITALDHRCHDLKAKQNWTELGRAAEQWSSLEPDRADPWLFRAEAAEAVKDWPHLVQYLDRIPRTDRRAVPALIRKAVTEFQDLNRPWDGVKTCDEVLELDPRVLIAHKQTIFFFAMTLQRAEMVRRIRRAIRVRRECPENYVYLVGASWMYSASLFRLNTRWLEADPESEIFHVAQAMEVYTSNAKSDPEHAFEFEHIPEAEELLKKYPQNQELVAYFLWRNITDGELEKVEELIRAVPKEVADADARFWRARAWCQDTRGESELAEQSLRKAFSIDPYWWQIHFQLHDLLRRLGRVDESARFFEIYKLSKELSIWIMTLNKTAQELDDQKFCRSLLQLAELVEDNEVIDVLRERVSER